MPEEQKKKRSISLGVYYEIIKAIIFLAIIAALGFGGLKAYNWLNFKFKQQEIQQQADLEEARKYKEYAENLARANTQLVNSLRDEIKKLRQENSAAIQSMLDDIDNKNEEITNLGETIASLRQDIVDLRVKADATYKEDTGDYNESSFKKVMYRTENEEGEKVEVPIAWAMYYPNREPDKRWKTGVYPLEYHSKIIQTEQEDGQWNTYTQVWFENNKDRESRGLEVPVDITSSEFKQVVDRKKEFHWWAPHVNLNLDAGYGGGGEKVGGGLSFSTSGYGRTKNDLTWRFLDFGISTDGDDLWGKFSPFAYNIGEHVPLVSNTFIGPHVGYSTDGDIFVGLSLSIPF